MRRASVVLLVLGLAAVAVGQLFPFRPEGTYVADSAGLIGAKDRQEITRLSKDLLARTGAPIVVATVTSLGSVQAQGMGIEAYAKKMFDSWHVGAKRANRGILLVVAKADHKARIEMGADWQHAFDARAQSVMTGTLVPAFKSGNYSGGIRDGVRKLEAMALSSSNPVQAPAESSLLPTATAYVPSAEGPDFEGTGSGVGVGSIVLVGVLFLAIFIAALIVSVARPNGPRRRTRGPWSDWNSPGPTQGSTNVWIDNSSTTDNSWVGGYDSGSSSTYDSDSSSGWDSGSSSSSDSGGFDSGSSGGGGDTGSW